MARPDAQRRLQPATPTSGARPIRSYSKPLACGGWALLRGESTFVGVTDVGNSHQRHEDDARRVALRRKCGG